MISSSKKLLQAAAGAAGGGPLAIEDVFSTYLYTGNGSTQTITNGIDLAGEGGLVWIKGRSPSTSRYHVLYDTERGAQKSIFTNTSDAEATRSEGLTSFNSDGFSVGLFGYENLDGNTFASWTFRKAPRFFDVVTYTGTGFDTTTQINHSLGVTPAVIIAKRLDSTSDWGVAYLRGDIGSGGIIGLSLNSTAASRDTGNTIAGNFTDTYFKPAFIPTATSNAFNMNESGASYVAYLFAHDPLGPSGDGSDGLIACGSYTSNNGGAIDVNLGWEPQWLMVKNTAGRNAGWVILDTMRGFSWDAANNLQLLANESFEELDVDEAGAPRPTPTGFSLAASTQYAEYNNATDEMIYIAIRRGPMRQPESGSEVFAMDTFGGTAPTPPSGISNFPVDMAWYKRLDGIESHWNSARLTGSFALQFNSTSAQSGPDANYAFDYNNGYGGWTFADINYQHWMFRRAPGFFDVVAYTGNSAGVTRNILLSANSYVCTSTYPCEMLISKSRSSGTWYVWHKDVQSGSPDYYLSLNSSNGETLQSGIFGVYGPSVTSAFNYFETSNNDDRNAAGVSYINYLFATLPGVSKVGSYTGNGSSQTINCGFTSGARFILIKRTDSAGDWYVWDTARGIVAANDPHLSLNTTAAEVTTDDSIDPDSSGFIVNQVAATNINVSSASYIFMAIS